MTERSIEPTTPSTVEMTWLGLGSGLGLGLGLGLGPLPQPRPLPLTLPLTLPLAGGTSATPARATAVRRGDSTTWLGSGSGWR